MKKYLLQFLFFVLASAVAAGTGIGAAQIKIKYFTKGKVQVISNPAEIPAIPANNISPEEKTPKEPAAPLPVSVVDSTVPDNNVPSQGSSGPPSPAAPANTKVCKVENPVYNLVGPRGNVSKGAPRESGFSDFAIFVPGVIGRSGRTSKNDLLWLKSQGWKGIVNMTLPGEHGGKDDDTLLPGFSAMGFHYINLPVSSGFAPSQKQAETFLAFVTNPVNQPVLVHCSAGHGRAGTMSALYRYSVQGWSLDKAFEEFKLFDTDGIDARQKNWLESWAAQNAPGSYACPTN